MKHFPLHICLIIALVGARSFAANSKLEQLNDFIRSDIKASKAAGLAVVIIEGGRITYSVGFGEEMRGSGRPITPNTLFQLQSFTKSVTAATALELVRLGKLDLAAPVTKYVPEFQLPAPWRADAITVRNVLMMTSGITSFPSSLDINRLPFDVSQPNALLNFVRSLAKEPLLIEPGVVFNYSNASYGLLGVIIERASGRDFLEATRRYVLTPAKMTTATFENSVAHGRPHAFVHGKNSSGESLGEDPTTSAESYFDRPWGGLYGSITDVGLFAEYLLAGRIATMTSDQIEKEIPQYSYGYGLHLQKFAFTGQGNDELVAWAAGTGPGVGVSSTGFTSALYFVPGKKFAVGVLSNDGDYSYNRVVSKAFELFLGRDRLTITATKTAPRTWRSFVGTYSGSTAIGDMIVFLENEKLLLKIPQLHFQTELIQHSNSMFLWAHLPQMWLEQNHLSATAYDANPIFSSSFLRKPGSSSPETDFLVSRMVIGRRVAPRASSTPRPQRHL